MRARVCVCVWQTLLKNEILSGLIVAVAQVPEAVAFAFLAGLDPLLGLHASWMMGMFIQVRLRLIWISVCVRVHVNFMFNLLLCLCTTQQ
jgi:hypothetical protein